MTIFAKWYKQFFFLQQKVLKSPKFLRRKIQPIMQAEQTECGLACLVMIANFWGAKLDLAAVREQRKVSLRGASFLQLISIAREMQLLARPLRVHNVADLKNVKLPALLHWDFNHFVVLESIFRNGLQVVDPACGRIVLPTAEFSCHYTGVLLEINPDSGVESLTGRVRLSLRTVFGHARSVVRLLPALAICVLGVEAITLVMPFLLRLLSGKHDWLDHRLISTLPYVYIALALLAAVISVIRTSLLLQMTSRLQIEGLSRVLSHLLRLPYSYFEARFKSNILSRFESLDIVYRTSTVKLLNGLIEGCFLTVFVCILAAIDLRVALVILSLLLISTATHFIFAGRRSILINKTLTAQGRQKLDMAETLHGVQTVLALNMRAHREARICSKFVETINSRNAEQSVAASVAALQRALSGFALLAIILIISSNSELSQTGNTVLVLAYSTFALTRLDNLLAALDEGLLLRVHLDILADMLLHKSEQHQTQVDAVSSPMTIEISDLSFRHSDAEPWILRDLSFRVEAGESVAITGPSGSGKTTLMKILLGLLEPTLGKVMVNGQELSSFGKDRFRDHTGSVLQDDYLFTGSIAENIAGFSSNPSIYRVQECASLAGVNADIERMPTGYQTIVGEAIGGLSGGQRQRVLLARALYRAPQLLILDEATSHLDVANETSINNRVAALPITRIIIAHRPNTIALAGREIQIPYIH